MAEEEAGGIAVPSADVAGAGSSRPRGREVWAAETEELQGGGEEEAADGGDEARVSVGLREVWAAETPSEESPASSQGSPSSSWQPPFIGHLRVGPTPNSRLSREPSSSRGDGHSGGMCVPETQLH